MENVIGIKIPKNFMNCAVTFCNHFVADTNDSANWDTIKFPLPKGKWEIKNTDVQKSIVYLIKVN